MSERDLKDEPHLTTDPNWWWHEENAGVMVFHQYVDAVTKRTECSMRLIPWRSLREALRRKDKP